MTMHVDYLVLGGGPAGLQLGYLLDQDHRDYVILEAGPAAGTFFRRFPRHRTLISSNKVHTGSTDPELNLRWDWNSLLVDDPELRFGRYSERYFPPADEMVRYLEDFAVRTRVKLRVNQRVTRIAANGHFEATTADGETYQARRVIVATGVTLPYLPAVPGIEHAEQYTDVSIDASTFTNQRVLILGKGNSAFETANHLAEHAAIIHVASPRTVQMAWQTHFVGHLRAVNNTILDTYQLKSQNAIIDGHCERLERRNGRYVATFRYIRAEESAEIEYDRVIACTGFRFDASIFDEATRPALAINGRFPALTSEWESTNVRDLYFAGTLMQTRDYRRSQSAFIHGFRYNLVAMRNVFNAKYEATPWPSTPIDGAPEALADLLLARINRSSALWQQFGFLADVVRFGRDGARYYTDVPVDYVADGRLGPDCDHLRVTLEYGHTDENYDPFRARRIVSTDAGRAQESTFLHPIIRRYAGERLVGEHHIPENLFAEWTRPEHRATLCAFLTQTYRAAAVGTV